MRANLLSLQNTSTLQAQTQERLATGKKVNSALDNPTSYFAAASLNDRASDLSNLLDGMGQAIQTITAATQGISAAESLIQQMQSVATSASQSVGTAGSSTSSNATAVASTTSTVLASSTDATNDLRSLIATTSGFPSLGIKTGDTLTVQVDSTGPTYTFTVGNSGANNTAPETNGGGTTMSDLNTWLNYVDGTTGTAPNVTMSVSGAGAITLTTTDSAHNLKIGGTLSTELGIGAATLNSVTNTVVGNVDVATGTYALSSKANIATTDTVLSNITQSNGTLLAATGSAGGGSYGQIGSTISFAAGETITLTAGMTIQNLIDKINQFSGLQANYNVADGITVDNETGASLTLGGTAWSLVAASTQLSTGAGNHSISQLYAGFGGTGGSGASELATYQAQYDTLRTQLDQLVQDTSYQGINLIASSTANPLKVQFNNDATNPNELVINAVDLTSSGLGLTSADNNWNGSTSITSSLSALTTANTTLRTQSSTFGQNLTTVQTRQDFTTNLINTLQTGAGNLTNADMNTESANMLALQTQQQLGISSLSLASQAAQGILKLFP
jgi:flagellin-like hook-associated protein FlgL